MFASLELTRVLGELIEEQRVREADDGCYYLSSSAGGGGSAVAGGTTGDAAGDAAGGAEGGAADGTAEAHSEMEPCSQDSAPPATELMEAADELWGESDVRQAIQGLITSGQVEIRIEELLVLVPPYLPRVAIEAVLIDLHHNVEENSIMYYDGIISVI